MFSFVLKGLVWFCLLTSAAVHLVNSNQRISRQIGLGLFMNYLSTPSDERGSCMAPGSRWGSCYTPAQCSRMGGQSSAGYCQDLRTLCCLMTTTCGGLVVANNTYFRMHPSGAGSGVGGNGEEESDFDGQGSCVVSVHKSSDSICQLRLDMRTFELSPPKDGQCLRDVFLVLGQNPESVVPPFCGRNNGQHLYVEVSGVKGPIILRLVTMGNFRRRLDLKISQIPCASRARAPSGCLQYLTGMRGVLKSLNFPEGPQQLKSPSYIRGLNYSICLRKESGFCGVTYEARDNDQVQPFGIPSKQVQHGRGGMGIYECSSDFLLLGGVRYCGDRLSSNMTTDYGPETNDPVTDTSSGPISAQFVTMPRDLSDHSDLPTTARGFLIHYSLNPCTG